MDLVDQAQESEVLFLATALAGIHDAVPEMPSTGRCYNCQAHVAPELRFCDADCRDDYARRKTAETRLGLARR